MPLIGAPLAETLSFKEDMTIDENDSKQLRAWRKFSHARIFLMSMFPILGGAVMVLVARLFSIPGDSLVWFLIGGILGTAPGHDAMLLLRRVARNLNKEEG